MNKQELYDYIMKSPYNTNPVILRQAIEGLSNDNSNSGGSGGGSGGNGVEAAVRDFRLFAPPYKNDGVVVDIEGTQMRQVCDQIPTVDENTLVCTLILFTDVVGNATSISMNSPEGTFIVNAELGMATGMDDKGCVFVSVDAGTEAAGFMGVTESGVYLRTDYNPLAFVMLFVVNE